MTALAGLYSAALSGDPQLTCSRLTAELTLSARGPQWSWMVAQCFAMVGEQDKALDWLENATRRGFINYPLLADMDPFMEPLRSTQRFENILKLVRRDWETFKI